MREREDAFSSYFLFIVEGHVLGSLARSNAHSLCLITEFQNGTKKSVDYENKSGSVIAIKIINSRSEQFEPIKFQFRAKHESRRRAIN
jgi:hypothetical protein